MRISDWSSDVCSSDLARHSIPSDCNEHEQKRRQATVEHDLQKIIMGMIEIGRLEQLKRLMQAKYWIETAETRAGGEIGGDHRQYRRQPARAHILPGIDLERAADGFRPVGGNADQDE